MKAANENEPLSFITLSAATAKVVSQLSQRNEQKNEDDPEKPKADEGDKRATLDHVEYIERRLAEIASWERKISGRKF